MSFYYYYYYSNHDMRQLKALEKNKAPNHWSHKERQKLQISVKEEISLKLISTKVSNLQSQSELLIYFPEQWLFPTATT